LSFLSVVVLDDSTDTTLIENTITDNATYYWRDWDSHGPGIALYNSQRCTLRGNTVTGNSTSGPTEGQGMGGGIYLENSGNSVLESNTVTGNSTLTRWGRGGGIALWSSANCLLKANTVTGNRTSGYNGHGGGIYLYNSSTGTGIENMGLRGNTVSDNVTTGSGADGGGINISDSGNTHLESNTITNNTSGDEGGGILLWNSGQWMLKSNVITDNTAARDGGGIYIGQSGCPANDPRCKMTNTVVARNHTNGDTGEIYVYNSPWLSFAGDPETGTYNVIGANASCCSDSCCGEGYCVYNNTPYDPTGSGDIDARYVDWCTNDTQAIQDCIYDYFDDARLGEVIWYPPAPAACCDAPCTTAPECDDGNPCTIDLCVEDCCEHAPVYAGPLRGWLLPTHSGVHVERRLRRWLVL
jgi:hypothetical protein